MGEERVSTKCFAQRAPPAYRQRRPGSRGRADKLEPPSTVFCVSIKRGEYVDSRARVLSVLATAGVLLVAALVTAANAQAEQQVDGKIVIFKAHHALNPYYDALGEPPAPAIVYDGRNSVAFRFPARASTWEGTTS